MEDVYIKDEGFADIKFLTDKAKEVAHRLGIPNQVQSIGDTFCGKPVWNETTKKGIYSCGFGLSDLKKVVKALTDQGLEINSEFGSDNL